MSEDILATPEVMAEIREAITKIVLNNTGPCRCDLMYTSRKMEDPLCAWHQYGVGIIEDTMANAIEED